MYSIFKMNENKVLEKILESLLSKLTKLGNTCLFCSKNTAPRSETTRSELCFSNRLCDLRLKLENGEKAVATRWTLWIIKVFAVMAALMLKGTPETLEKSISLIKFSPKLTDLYQRSCDWVICDIAIIYKMNKIRFAELSFRLRAYLISRNLRNSRIQG